MIAEINEASALEYSKLDVAAFGEASAKAGLPVNPSFGYQGAYIELVQPLMLTLPKPKSDESLQVLFSGANLAVKTGSGADLVASKLYRYSEQDQEDVQFLKNPSAVPADELKALDEAAMLHLPLPQGGYASVRALYRLAAYQAGSCDYGMRGFIANVRRRLNRPPLSETAVPAGMVKDVVLPKYRVPEF